MTPADIDRLSRMAFEAGLAPCSSDMLAALARFEALATARANEARRQAQIENQALKEREARAGLVMRRAVAKERELCLEIADACADADMHASMVANAIRARRDAPELRPGADGATDSPSVGVAEQQIATLIQPDATTKPTP